MAMIGSNGKINSDFLLLDRLYNAIKNGDPHPRRTSGVELNPKVFENLLEDITNVDYQISKSDYLLDSTLLEYIGYTPLHLMFQINHMQSFQILLNRGANFTLKDYNNRTVIHKVVEENFAPQEEANRADVYENYDASFTLDCGRYFTTFLTSDYEEESSRENFKDYKHWRLRRKLNNSYINQILSAHIKYENSENPCSSYGFSHFHAACMENNTEAVEFFLKNGVDVNQSVNLDSPIFPGFTPLHFAIWYTNVNTAKVLLKNGADIHMKNSFGQTPLQMLLDLKMKTIEWMHVTGELPYCKAIVDFYNNEEILDMMMQNINEKADLFNFCVACTMKNISYFEKFLKKIKNVNESLSKDFKMWHGWTPLHFAAFFNNIEIIKLLLQAGADIEAKNVIEVTPFDMLLQKAKKKEIISILSSKQFWKNISLSDGKTLLLDVINAMDEKDTFDSFLKNLDVNTHIPKDAPLWPGYTILHLAVMFSEKLTLLDDLSDYTGDNYIEKYNNRCSKQETRYLEKIKVCMENKANINIQDIHGRTPAHQAFRQREIKAIHHLFQYDKQILNIVDKDNLSTLHIACASKVQKLVSRLYVNRKLLDSIVLPSFKWQNKFYDNVIEETFNIIGSTALHMAVINGDEIITKILIGRGSNINLKDSQGLTPIHRAFIKRFLWDLISLCDHCYFLGLDEALKIDKDNLQIFWSSPYLKESIVDNIGLSNLYIACYESNFSAVEKLLNKGYDPNVTLKNIETLDSNHPLTIVHDHLGYTPLQMTQLKYSPVREIQKILIEHGTDILNKAADGSCFFLENLVQKKAKQQIDTYVSYIRHNKIAEKRLKDEYGWSMLHVACQAQDFELAQESLKNGIDVNSRIHEDAKYYPGFTPLHVAMAKERDENVEPSESKINWIIQLLLDNDANVSMTTMEGHATALHLSRIFSKNDRSVYNYEVSEKADLILKHIKDFTVNPMDDQGLSMFHIACIRHDLEAMENFLKNGVDVNRPTELFKSSLSGCSPLQLVVQNMPINPWPFIYCHAYRRHESFYEDQIQRQLQAFDLLVKYGANVHTQDSYNNTLFHSAVHRRVPIILLDKILGVGVDITLTNIYGRNPFQEFFYSSHPRFWEVSPKEMEFFFKHLPDASAINRLTNDIDLFRIGPHLLDLYFNSESIFCKIMGLPSLTGVDELGRSAIHLLVSSELSSNEIHEIIGYLLQIGMDIDQQDNFGRTALHTATIFDNADTVEYLLLNDADFDVIDSYGKTAFSYTEEPKILDVDRISAAPSEVIERLFHECFYEMELRGLTINEINKKVLRNKYPFMEHHYPFTLKDVKNKQVGSTSLKLNDFWSETGAIVDYPKVSKKNRKKISKFFNQLNYDNLGSWVFCFKMQYKKALVRSKWVELAEHSMSNILGYPFPYVCFDIVQQFLSNQDLKNLVKSANLRGCDVYKENRF